MSKSRRLTDALAIVRQRRELTAADLAEALGVSRRTALRYLQELSETGVPLAAQPGPHGGYRLIRDKSLPPVTLTVDEAVALFFAYQSLSGYGRLPFRADANTAVQKLYGELPPGAQRRIDALQHRFAFMVESRDVEVPHLDTLVHAAADGEVLRILYRSARGNEARLIQPVGVYAENGYWYCPAYAFERERMRVFRADRVLAANVVTEPAPREDIRALTLDSYYRAFERPRAQFVPMVVRLTREGARQLAGHHDLSVNNDGSGEIRTTVDERNIPFFARRFAALGTDAVVLAPKSLRMAIQRMAQDLLTLYGAPDDSPD